MTRIVAPGDGSVWDPERAAPGHPPFSSDGEPVHAVMITGKPGRGGLAERSFGAFLNQTYGNRRLLVVTDGPDIDVRGAAADRVRVIRIEGPLVLGALRNLALDQVPEGEVWVQWDDDDWHHPSLVAEQLAVLLDSSAGAVTLRSQIRYSFELDSAWVAESPAPEFGFAGTLMARRAGAFRYPEVRLGEDSALLAQLIAAGVVVPCSNPPGRYVRLIHGGNSWGRLHFGLHRMPRGRWMLEPADRRALDVILRTYQAVVGGGAPDVPRQGRAQRPTIDP